MMIMDPMSYIEAIIPVSVDFSPNLLSIDVITTLTKPLMQTPCMNAAIDRNTKNHFGPRNMFKNFNLMQPNEQSSNTTVSSSLKFSVLAVGVFRFTSSLANPWLSMFDDWDQRPYFWIRAECLSILFWVILQNKCDFLWNRSIFVLHLIHTSLYHTGKNILTVLFWFISWITTHTLYTVYLCHIMNFFFTDTWREWHQPHYYPTTRTTHLPHASACLTEKTSFHTATSKLSGEE